VDHHRQKRVIDPGFGPVQLRQFYSVFRTKAAKVGCHARRGVKITAGANPTSQLSTRLHEVVGKSDGKIINIAPWLAHTTLDIIGESELKFLELMHIAKGISCFRLAALNYPFNTLDNHQDELTSVYENLL